MKNILLTLIILAMCPAARGANEIEYFGSVDLANLYVIVEQKGVGYWDGDGYVTTITSWGSADIALTQSGVQKGKYLGDMPATAPAGRYYITVYQSASPANTDIPLQTWQMDWDGSAEITLTSTLTANVTQVEGTDATDFFTNMNEIADDWLDGGRLDLILDKSAKFGRY